MSDSEPVRKSKYEELVDELYDPNDRPKHEILPILKIDREEEGEELAHSYENLHKKDSELISLLLTNDPDGLKKNIVVLEERLEHQKNELDRLERDGEKYRRENETILANNEILQQEFKELVARLEEKEVLIESLQEKFNDIGTIEGFSEFENITMKHTIDIQESEIKTLKETVKKQSDILDQVWSKIETLETLILQYKHRIVQLEDSLEAKTTLLNKFNEENPMEWDDMIKDMLWEEEKDKDEIIHKLEARVRELEAKLGPTIPTKKKTLGHILYTNDLIKLNNYRRFISTIPSIGTYRIILIFKGERGGTELEMVIDNLQYHVVNEGGDRKLVVSLGSGNHIRYVFNVGGFPRDYVHRKGQLSLTLYDRGRVVRSNSYDYKFNRPLEGGEESIVEFGDTTLYATYVTTNIYKLKMLVQGI
jgi:hypothetical protein